ncbi:MAG: bifunctional phosphoserine phosphatase/homoserine phosphotransferase ThrH [Pseudomonadales bacterium]|nr:bifunctional phosphoserine phosphatase/homoserine phosphotransferase ThrH [Pseudomonadales bacterium]
MDILCLDLEGVLAPEIWVGVAKATGIEELTLTTQDIPVYEDLMDKRLEIIEKHDIGIDLIQKVIGELEPLPGAKEFLAWARRHFQVAIISDTFYEFALPIMAQLDYPMLLCHKLTIKDNRIVGYNIRQSDPKRHSVAAFQGLKYQVLAAGDSYNDIPMLDQADKGFFFMAPEKIQKEFPQFSAANTYAELQKYLLEAS